MMQYRIAQAAGRVSRTKNMIGNANLVATSRGPRPDLTVVFAMVVLVFLGWCACLRAEEASGDDARVQSIFAGGAPATREDLKEMQRRQQQLVKKVSPWVVAIVVGPSQGSGVIVSEDGYVLTAAHVIGRPGRRVTLITAEGRSVRGTSLGTNRNLDAGLVKIDDQNSEGGRPWPHAKLGGRRLLTAGQWVLAMGFPGGISANREPVLRVGRVLETSREWTRTDCKLVGGDSGGPLFDMEGRVVGIHSRIGSSLANNLHVPVTAFSDDWERLARSDDWGRLPGPTPYLGVRGDGDADVARITQVFPDTPADRAGIRVGDVVTDFDGKPVGNFDSLKMLVETKTPGDKVKVRIRRDDRTLEFRLDIGDLGASAP